MKTPVPPPDFEELLHRVVGQSERFLELFAAGEGVGDDEYLPWDKLRFKQPPGGLSHEEWWLTTRLSRNAMQRKLPLLDKDGSSFSYAMPDEVLRLVEDIGRRASGQIALPEQVTNPATRDRYIVSSLIEEAITSSQLEGASTSRAVAKEMLRSGRPPRDLSERMIVNNYLAMQRVGALRESELTPELVCEIHRIVTDGTLDDPTAAGRVQSNPDPDDRVKIFGDDRQIIHVPPPVGELPRRLELLCSFANGTTGKTWMPPVLRAIAVHFMIGYDHYFEDGNGRTARALFYWSMLKQGYWLAEFVTISNLLKKAPSKYAGSFMLTEQDGGDLTYFFIYHLKIIHRAIDELQVYLQRKMKELRDTRLLLAATPGDYNHRQLALLELAMKDAGSVFTAESHARSHNASRETARQDLSDLENRGFVSRGKRGKRFVWAPVKNLAERIRQAQH